MSENLGTVIVGAGHGGVQAAASLLQLASSNVMVISDEADLPYERPPLSKDYLAGGKPFDQILLRPANFWTGPGVTLRRGTRVQTIDAAAHRIGLHGGESIGYDKLVWAGGGRARRLTCSGHSLAGVHGIRTRADVDRLVQELPAAGRVIVIGGGYIGLEAAAVLTKLGKPVVLLEALDRVLARVAGEPLSRFYEAEHRARGVDLRLGVSVSCIDERDGRAVGVTLADGSHIPAEIVIVGVGIIPEIDALREAGAACSNGVEVDAFCRTTLPDVYAIGDCAAHLNAFAGGARIRLESVQNASDQAKIAAKSIAGVPEPYHAVPWFWSHQYDLKLQTVGLSGGFDQIIVRGDPAARSFSLVYLRRGRVIALDCVNATRDFVQGKSLVANGTAPSAAALADPTVPLNRLAA